MLIHQIRSQTGDIISIDNGSEVDEIWIEIMDRSRKGFRDNYHQSDLSYRLFMAILRTHLHRENDIAGLAKRL